MSVRLSMGLSVVNQIPVVDPSRKTLVTGYEPGTSRQTILSNPTVSSVTEVGSRPVVVERGVVLYIVRSFFFFFLYIVRPY